MAAKDRIPSFEEAISRLEAVVRELEDGRLPLERALDLFTEGIELSRVCSRNLESAEQRIAILTRDDKGKVVLKEVDTVQPAGEGKNVGF